MVEPRSLVGGGVFDCIVYKINRNKTSECDAATILHATSHSLYGPDSSRQQLAKLQTLDAVTFCVQVIRHYEISLIATGSFHHLVDIAAAHRVMNPIWRQ